MIKYPQVKILSPTLDMLGILDSYTSLRHKRSWQGVGEFELHTSQFLPDLFKIGNFIMLDNVHKNGIITSIKSSFNSGKRDTVITGTTLNGLASRRIVLPFSDDNLNRINGGYFCVPHKRSANDIIEPVPAETIIKEFAKNGFGFGDSSRAFPNLAFIVNRERGNKAVWMSRYEQLDTVLQAISEYCDIGWEIYPVFGDSPYLAFNILTGIDRSSGQNENSSVIISRDFYSASNITYSVDVSGYKNVAYSGGAGDNADRVVIAVTNENNMPTGYDRFRL